MKEVVITDEIRLAVAREQLEKTYKNVKLAAGTTTVMAAIKGGSMVIPKALTFIKGSTIFLGCLPIPNYFTVLGAGLFLVDAYVQFIAYKDRIQDDNG